MRPARRRLRNTTRFAVRALLAAGLLFAARGGEFRAQSIAPAADDRAANAPVADALRAGALGATAPVATASAPVAPAGDAFFAPSPFDVVVRVQAADPQAEGRARALAARAKELITFAAIRLDLPAPREVTVLVVSAAPRDEAQARALDLPVLPGWVAGLAEPWRHRILLFLDRLDVAGHDGLSGALAHEAAHLVLNASLPAGVRVPRWYDEGLAMTVERAVSFSDAWQLARMVLVDQPRPLAALDRGFPAQTGAARAAYAQSLSFVSHAQSFALPGAPRRLVLALREGADFDRAFTIAYGVGVGPLEVDWRRGLRDRYVLVPLVVGATIANLALGVLAFAAMIAGRRRHRARMAALPDGEHPEFDERISPGEPPPQNNGGAAGGPGGSRGSGQAGEPGGPGREGRL